MDSLVANYASSDEDEEQELPPKQLKAAVNQGKSNSRADNEGNNSQSPPKSSLSLPNPSSPPKLEQQRHKSDERGEQILQNSIPKSSSSSMFSRVPAPKSSASSNRKRVVQFKPPTMLNPYPDGVNDDDDDEDDEGEKERQRKKLKESVSTSSAAAFVLSMPAPRSSANLGTLGTGRKSMFETVAPASTERIDSVKESGANVDASVGFIGDQSREMSYDYSSRGLGNESHAHFDGHAAGHNSAGFVGASGVSTDGYDVGLNSHGSSEVWSSGMNYDYSGAYSGNETYANSDGYVASNSVNVSSGAVDYSFENVEDVQYTNPGVSYVGYGNNTQYEDKWANVATLPEVSNVINELQVSGKRGRKDAPPQIIEVKQDELMKNRPREDQVKSTGIAFGPAYQPTSSKGKPTKLHKRKHQIGSLYFDMRQKETALAERRSQGFQTKAQTQAKYGW